MLSLARHLNHSYYVRENINELEELSHELTHHHPASENYEPSFKLWVGALIGEECAKHEPKEN